MKSTLTTMVLAGTIASCGSYDGDNQNSPYEGTNKYEKNSPKLDEDLEEEETEKYISHTTKDVCSYNSDRNKGCMKAVIASSELYVGDYYYSFGPKEMARKFARELQDNPQMDLEMTETLELTRRVSHANFFGGWTIALEGAHSTYQVHHTGLGNLRVDDMSPGFYNVLLVKEFELRVLDEEQDIVGYRCAIIYARRPIDVIAGRETAFKESISEFEVEVFRESCSGTKKAQKKEIKPNKDSGSKAIIDLSSEAEDSIEIAPETSLHLSQPLETAVR